MAHTARVRFYEVDLCGFYQRGTSGPMYGDLLRSIEHLHAWATQEGMELRNTKTFDHQEDTDYLPVYCQNILLEHTDEALLTTWNEVESMNGAVASMSGSEPVGSNKVRLAKTPRGHIPGYATYFWIIPRRNLLATIQFKHRLNGHAGLKQYMKAFLERHSPHARRKETSPGEYDILGYSRSETENPDPSVLPRFNSKLAIVKTEAEYVTRHISRIRKFHAKTDLHQAAASQQKDLSGFLSWFGVGRRNYEDHSYNFYMSHDLQPEQDELESIISAYQDDGFGWDDVGFTLQGEQAVRWLGRGLASQKIDLDISWDNDELVNSQSLSKAIQKHRKKLLGLVPQYQSEAAE